MMTRDEEFTSKGMTAELLGMLLRRVTHNVSDCVYHVEKSSKGWVSEFVELLGEDGEAVCEPVVVTADSELEMVRDVMAALEVS